MGAEIFLPIGLMFLYAIVPLAAVTIGRRYRRLRWWWPLVPLLSYVITPVWLTLWASFPAGVGHSATDRRVGDTQNPGSLDID